MVNWHDMVYPEQGHSVIEVVIRGTVMYLGLFLLMRVILKRQTGALGMSDLLLITLLADASQNGMAGEYRSITEGLSLVLTIIFWNYLLDWLSYRSDWFRKLIEPQPLLLIQNGNMIKENMRRELVTVDELRGHLREQGIEHIGEVARATIESDGRISVVKIKKGL